MAGRLGSGLLPTSGNRWRTGPPPDLELSATLAELWHMQQRDRADRRIGFMAWSMRVPEPKTGTLDFDRFPFQRELYDEAAADKEIVIDKASQVGVSTYALRWVMYWADMRGWTGVYLFPKRRQVYDFSDARVRPVIVRSEYLSDRVPAGHIQNKGLKQVGLGFVYFRGTESRDDVLGVDADHVVMDEYDDLRPDHIPEAERRIGASQHGLIRRVGVPRYPGTGISALYELTDQRRWTVKCGACGEWQSLDFYENVDQARAIRVCRRCSKALDVATGEWVADFPDREVRGYHMSRLIVPDASVAEIVKNSRGKTPLARQNFFNHDLGLPFAPEEGRLSDAALQAAQSAGAGLVTQPGYVGNDLVTMGIDVASVRELNVRISRHIDDRRKAALWIGKVSNFDELAPLMDRYSVRMAAIDHLPEGRLARAFAERFAGRVYLVAQTTQPTAQVIAVNEQDRLATVRRIEMLDATLELIRQQRNLLPLDWPEEYPAHLKALQRVLEEDGAGRKVVRYIATGDADYAMAEAHDVVATDLYFYRVDVAAEIEPREARLEDHYAFDRAQLADPDADPDYYAGPDADLSDFD